MMQPVALTLVVLVFAGLNQLATTNWIEIYPVPTPPEVLIYVERTGICTSEDRIISQLPTVFQIHRDAVLRFITELGERYDQLLDVKFKIINSERAAHVIFRAKKLEPPIIGQTFIGDTLPLEVEIDCGLASYPDFYMQAIILHELYHTLGIGHIRNDVSGDLMGGPISDVRRPVYPTTLTLYAIYLRYFGGLSNAKTSIQLPSSIPYVQSRPFSESIEYLSKQVESLSRDLSRYMTAYEEAKQIIANDIASLRNDVVFLRNTTEMLESRINGTESKVDSLGSQLSDVVTQVSNLGGEVSSLKEGQRSISESLSGIKASLDRSGREIELLRGSLTALSAELEKQSRTVTILSLVVLVLSAAVPAVAVYFRRRGGG